MTLPVAVAEIAGVLTFEPPVFRDNRGYLFESWHAERHTAAGVPPVFVQDNVSRSLRGVLRGLHVQEPFGQGKLIQVLDGEVFDVAVDVRVGSPTFGRWVGFTLSAENRRQLYLPPGVAHGFCVLGSDAVVTYKCTEFYRPDAQLTVAWNDTDLGITWPTQDPVVSTKDACAPRLVEIPRDRLPRWQP
jgi:dTDP-4-dehydrorhamnose 3,5-epimerase